MLAPIVALSALASLFTARAQTTLPADCARNYTVHLGDVCDSISAANNVSTFQLPHANPTGINADCSNLALGQPLCLGITGQDCTQTHVVISGEGCWQIATDAGTDLTTLLANNPNVNEACSNIYPGEVLCVASTLIAYD